MPTCSETYGQGWVGEYPNCSYDASTPAGTGQEQTPFTGTVGSLGYGEELAGSSWEEDWQKFFDPYDPAREEMATRHAGIDVGQLQSAWDLQSGQLGESWGLREEQLGEAWGLRGSQLGEAWELQQGQLGEGWQQRREGLGAEAGLGYRNIFGAGQQARGKSGMAFAGGAEEMQRMQLQDVGGSYERAFGLGKTAYEQAMASGAMGYEQAMETGEMGYTQALETGELGLQHATTDIYQGLESDIFGQRESWEEQNRATLNVLLGSGIWPGDDDTTTTTTTEAIGGYTGNIPYGIARGYQQWMQAWDGTSQPPSSFGEYYPTIGAWSWNGTEYTGGSDSNPIVTPTTTPSGTGSLVTGTQDMSRVTGAKRYG
jgi:hypothetical protein